MFLDCLPDFESLDLACRTSQYPKAAFESDGSSDWPGASGTCPAGARQPTPPPAHGPDHVSPPLSSSCNRREDVIRKRLDVSCRLCPTFRNSPSATAKNLSNSVHRPRTLVGGRKPSCPFRSPGSWSETCHPGQRTNAIAAPLHPPKRLPPPHALVLQPTPRQVPETGGHQRARPRPLVASDAAIDALDGRLHGPIRTTTTPAERV